MPSDPTSASTKSWSAQCSPHDWGKGEPGPSLSEIAALREKAHALHALERILSDGGKYTRFLVSNELATASNYEEGTYPSLQAAIAAWIERSAEADASPTQGN